MSDFFVTLGYLLWLGVSRGLAVIACCAAIAAVVATVLAEPRR